MDSWKRCQHDPAWWSYVPQRVGQEVRNDPENGADRLVERLDGVALFADISGFTPLTEALRVAGRSGAEELTRLLNDFFETMVSTVEGYGGDVWAFAGDALTAVFAPGTVGAEERAVACALEMQARTNRYRNLETSAGTFELALKIGLGAGPLVLLAAGDRSVGLHAIAAGRALDRAAGAERLADKGMVVAGLNIAARVPGVERAALEGAATEVEIRGLTAGPASSEPPAPGPPADAMVAGIEAFLHPAVAARARAGTEAFGNEHRVATLVFGSFDRFAVEDSGDAVAALDSAVVRLARLVADFGGFLAQVGMGEKGSTFFAVFGAPTAHEDHAQRALRFALELQTGATGLTGVAVGVATGFAFAGLVGSTRRRSYAAIGDSTNLAARLMQAAQPGQVLVAGDVDPLPGVHVEPRGELAVKGKSHPVLVCEVESRVSDDELARHPLEPAAGGPLVGRAREREIGRAALKRARAGRGGTLLVQGEAGIGKSRLASALVELAADSGFEVLSGACQPYGTARRWAAWRRVWERFFGLSRSDSATVQVERLAASLAGVDTTFAARLPLLGPVLGLSIPHNELTRGLEPELAAELTRSLLVSCLHARAELSPVLVVLEDCHWIDPSSAALVEELARSLDSSRIAMLVVSRPLDAPPPAWAEELLRRPTIALGPLGPEALASIARRRWQRAFGLEAEPPAGLLDAVVERAEGNPFYVEELVSLLHDRGFDGATWKETLSELPSSLYALVSARLDGLGEGPRSTLRAASVLGRLVRARWLAGAFADLGGTDVVCAHLDELTARDVLVLQRPEPELEYLFRHAITQDVAYESLSFGLRETLHDRFAGFLERTEENAPERFVDTLAFHYGRSRNVPKQRLYFRAAGDAARAAYANATAIAYYERLLPLLEAGRRAQPLRLLGSVLELTGSWPDAGRSYEQAVELAEAAGDVAEAARAYDALGFLLAHQDSYGEAVRVLERASTLFEELRDEPGTLSALDHLGFTYVQQSEYGRALACAERQLELATRLGEPAAIAAASGAVGLVLHHRGEYEDALAAFERSFELARSAGSRPAVVHAGNDLAGVLTELGRHAEAFRGAQAALDAALEIGYAQAAAVIVSNAGELYRLNGEAERALPCYWHGLEAALRLHDLTGVLGAVAGLGAALRALGRSGDAERLLARAVELGRRLDNPWFLTEAMLELAELLAGRGQIEEALRTVADVTAIAEASGLADRRQTAEKLRAALDGPGPVVVAAPAPAGEPLPELTGVDLPDVAELEPVAARVDEVLGAVAEVGGR